MDGVLLIDKPKTWTSFDVVAKTRSILKKSGVNIKVGHSGTLDPLASGLLIILLGNFTKKAESFTKLDKTYAVTMKLGESSITGDEEGEKHKISSLRPSEDQIKAVLTYFTGEQQQVPPLYSAIKINGKRAYKLAREGKAPQLSPRKVDIYEIVLGDYSYPFLSFITSVSSGTYIRSLVSDMGEKLGTGAYTTELRRNRIGKYSIDDALDIEQLNFEEIKNRLQRE